MKEIGHPKIACVFSFTYLPADKSNKTKQLKLKKRFFKTFCKMQLKQALLRTKSGNSFIYSHLKWLKESDTGVSHRGHMNKTALSSILKEASSI